VFHYLSFKKPPHRQQPVLVRNGEKVEARGQTIRNNVHGIIGHQPGL
jgi:hypothetical protein